EGEYGASAGSCVQRGYAHVVLPPQPIDHLQIVAAHELTHACVAHLRLPQWAEEGLTQAMEGEMHSWPRINQPSAEELLEVKRYWRENNIQDFWWHRGFYLPDEGQKSSYELARVLFHFLVTDYKDRYLDFLRDADADDAGEGAARERLGLSLAALAERFL